MAFSGEAQKPHILAIPLPFQGHINPMTQLCKRLVSKGLKVTIITTTSIPHVPVKDEHNSLQVELFEEYTGEVEAPVNTIYRFLERYRITITSKLNELLEKKASSGDPVKVILYDALITWGLDLAKSLGFSAAVFFTQSCAVVNICNNIFHGELEMPLIKNNISLYSMPEMEANDLPTFVSNSTAYPGVLETNVSQINSLEKANWILFNSFDELELEVVSHLRQFYQIRTVGPLIPSNYLDKRLKEDKAYNFNFFQISSKEKCMKWLDTKSNASVIYVSFGSISDLRQDQTDEITSGIIRSNCDFLWTLRATEQNKLPNSLKHIAQERGLIVEWCPQLEVLAHKAIRCFVTHCGWNSTLEALSFGVPMVSIPLWIDQPTNAKYIADVWKVGVRVKTGENGIFSSDEVESAIRKAMNEEKENEMKKNALKWKEFAIKAMSEGGSSDKCIQEFVGYVKALG